MARARYNQETRDFIEGVFKTNGYDLDRQISYLEIMERQKYHYQCDASAGGWGWTAEQAERYNSEWDEIIDMLNERKILRGA